MSALPHAVLENSVLSWSHGYCYLIYKGSSPTQYCKTLYCHGVMAIVSLFTKAVPPHGIVKYCTVMESWPLFPYLQRQFPHTVL
jgi:hypothetical protein